MGEQDKANLRAGMVLTNAALAAAGYLLIDVNFVVGAASMAVGSTLSAYNGWKGLYFYFRDTVKKK